MSHHWAASLHVIEPHDVVFTQARTQLNFDHLQVKTSRVLQPKKVAQRNAGGLVFGQQELALSACDPSGALDHNPVLNAVVLRPRRQGRAGVYKDAIGVTAKKANEGHLRVRLMTQATHR